jgi:hypothetical protein
MLTQQGIKMVLLPLQGYSIPLAFYRIYGIVSKRVIHTLIHQVLCLILIQKEYAMSKNTSANRPAKEVRPEVKSKPEITELSFEAMETLSGGGWCTKWSHTY